MIGDGLLMGSGNHVGHHSRVGDFCFISNGVTISGGCTIGQECYLAPSATIDMGVQVGAGSYIGSATLTRRNIPESSVVRPRESPLAKFSAKRLRNLV
jgi:UDP-3-O-[3-hydroxymyristoyl] glucosamine N-acyltransferase